MTRQSVLWVTVGIFFCITAVAALLFLNDYRGQWLGGGTDEQASTAVTRVRDAMRTGDFTQAIAQAEAIQNDPTVSNEQKAVATYATLGAQYWATSDQTARIIDIQNMKKIILDEKVSLRTRVNTLNVLANQYSISGRDSQVFAEIYKDAPYKGYLVPNDPDLSARKLFEWSYSLLPTSSSAIGIARWYSEQAVLNPQQSEKVTKEFAQVAESYLKKAEEASLEEAGEDRSFTVDSTRYLVYHYWRTIIIGRLAAQVGAPYSGMYRTEYTNFITFASVQKNVIARSYLYYARLFFAQRLAQDGSSAEALAQLNVLAQELSAISDPDVNVFVRYLHEERASRPSGSLWRGVERMFEISPNFKTEVEKLLSR